VTIFQLLVEAYEALAFESSKQETVAVLVLVPIGVTETAVDLLCPTPLLAFIDGVCMSMEYSCLSMQGSACMLNEMNST
jgi:hypothetical protein